MIPKVIVHGEKVSIELDFQNRKEAIQWLLDGNNINDLAEAVITEYSEQDGK